MAGDSLKRAWVLGSTGMLGLKIAADWSARGIDCVRIASKGADINVDLTDAAGLARLFASAPPDLIVNCAAQTDHKKCETEIEQSAAINVRLVEHLAAYSVRTSTRLVQISTDHYYCNDGAATHTETDPVEIVNRYAEMKYAGEQAALKAPHALVVRTNIVGYRLWKGRPTFAEWLVGDLFRGAPITGYTDYFTSSIDVGTLSSALWELEQGAKPVGTLNIASHAPSSKYAFLKAVARRFGFDDSRIAAGSVANIPGPRRANSLGLDVSRVEALLGRQMPDLNEVAENLYREFQGNDAIQQFFQDR